MIDMSVADILKMHGEWIPSKQFVSLVSKKLGISERQAYRKIKEAVKNKKIIKSEFANIIAYGLAAFGSPVERITEKPARMGFFGWLHQRAERKRIEKEMQRKRLLANKHTYLQLLAEFYDLPSYRRWADIEKKNLEEIEKECH